jgi:hypothetical protein
MWSEVVKDLERLWERPIVSDAYRPFESVATDRRTVVQGERLERYLDRTCRIWKRRWGYAAPVLTFQRLDWLLHRPMQLPESRARHWKQQAIETNHWALDHVQAPLALANARLRVESTEEVFALHVEVPGAPARTRRLELACLPAWIQQLRNEEAARVAALRAAAGLGE